MGKAKFIDQFDRTVAKFEKTLRFAENSKQKTFTLKEQIEQADKEKRLKNASKTEKSIDEERFIQTSFYFKHER